MTPEVTVTPIHDAEGLQHLRNALPGLRAMNDDEAVDALLELYGLGYSSGAEAAEKAMKDMGQWLSRLALAHTKKDALGVKAILDEFVAARCVVKGGPNPTVQH